MNPEYERTERERYQRGRRERIERIERIEKERYLFLMNKHFRTGKNRTQKEETEYQLLEEKYKPKGKSRYYRSPSPPPVRKYVTVPGVKLGKGILVKSVTPEGKKIIIQPEIKQVMSAFEKYERSRRTPNTPEYLEYAGYTPEGVATTKAYKSRVRGIAKSRQAAYRNMAYGSTGKAIRSAIRMGAAEGGEAISTGKGKARRAVPLSVLVNSNAIDDVTYRQIGLIAAEAEAIKQQNAISRGISPAAKNALAILRERINQLAIGERGPNGKLPKGRYAQLRDMALQELRMGKYNPEKAKIYERRRQARASRPMRFL